MDGPDDDPSGGETSEGQTATSSPGPEGGRGLKLKLGEGAWGVQVRERQAVGREPDGEDPGPRALDGQGGDSIAEERWRT